MSNRAKELLKLIDGIKPQYEGGQKKVYVLDTESSEQVVLKVGKFYSRNEFERAKRETQIQTNLDSSYYPRVYEFEVFNDTYVIVEEFIDGSPLSEIMCNFVEIKKSLVLLKKLIEGLQLIWPKIIHRDLKPANIMVDKHNKPIIIDLGIARFIEQTSLTISSPGIGPCTQAYAAIEQLTNRKHDIDWRTDQFALGIIIAQILMHGQHPFDPRYVGNSNSFSENIINGMYKLDVHRKVIPLLSKMLGKEPYNRFRKVENLIKALNGILEEM